MSDLLKKDADWVWERQHQDAFDSIKASLHISGAVDFIFGMRAKAWFESCDVESIGEGYITANGNQNSTIESEYIFNRARVSGSSGNGSTYLGRPWRPYARVVWQNSELGDVVNSQGWSTWNGDPHLSQRMARWLSFFAEYNFRVEYKPGKLNVLADALSRRPD
ncbi:Pleiotropic drug resistance protein [Phytophthora palmivora]|uniref:Pectinesterase n=1 Tax=Phytophthora palmivora TaxID=4796 RepID=A0A2P4YNW6_9STRA|nr:Pleiotropic drug resistance protein [Phytophthora palmivora]